jgi:hypothetical protein
MGPAETHEASVIPLDRGADDEDEATGPDACEAMPVHAGTRLPGGAVDSDRMMDLTQIRCAMRNEIATMRACAREIEMQPAKVEAAAEAAE